MEKDGKTDRQSLKRLVMFLARPDIYAESRLPRMFLSLSVMVNSRPPNPPPGLMLSCSFFKGDWPNRPSGLMLSCSFFKGVWLLLTECD